MDAHPPYDEDLLRCELGLDDEIARLRAVCPWRDHGGALANPAAELDAALLRAGLLRAGGEDPDGDE